jgi:glycosyltransferase involved in cell wall biosynthesis
MEINKMNILIFNWRDIKNSSAGGAEFYLHEQAKIWAKQGNEINWICGGWTGCLKNEIVDGVNIRRIGGEFTQYMLAPFEYIKLKNKADVIIDAENGIPFFTPLYSKKKIILLIHHIHRDVWFKEKKFPISWIGNFLETKIMPFIYKNKRIVTVSPSSLEEINKIMKNNSVDVVYNAISDKCYDTKKKGGQNIIFVGRIKKYKSIDVLLKAVSRIDKNLIVNIVGRGDDELRLKNITKLLGLKNVRFWGFVEESEKIKLLQNATLAVNPSFVEGWSITNIEANACGTIVIGSNVNGIKDSIIDKKTGLLFKYGDEKELAEKISSLLGDRRLREKMEAEAIRRAKNFSWTASAEKFLSILKES